MGVVAEKQQEAQCVNHRVQQTDQLLQHGQRPVRRVAIIPLVLFSTTVLLSLAAGYLLGQLQPLRFVPYATVVPASYDSQARSQQGAPAQVYGRELVSANGDVNSATTVTTQSEAVQNQPLMMLLPSTEYQLIVDQMGQMQAELLRMHAIFVRLAEHAQLYDGEFQLEPLELSPPALSLLTLKDVALLKTQLDHMSSNVKMLEVIVNERSVAKQLEISGRPLKTGSRSSGFGKRVDPFTGKSQSHRGLDFSGQVGEPILALAAGVVTFAGTNSGYGKLVELEHINGYRTRYAHNDKILVKRGEHVDKGTAIALLGSTGRSTGPHVHVEVRHNGAAIDPAIFVR